MVESGEDALRSGASVGRGVGDGLPGVAVPPLDDPVMQERGTGHVGVGDDALHVLARLELGQRGQACGLVLGVPFSGGGHVLVQGGVVSVDAGLGRVLHGLGPFIGVGERQPVQDAAVVRVEVGPAGGAVVRQAGGQFLPQCHGSLVQQGPDGL